MSGKQPIFVDANDPEYYAGLLSNLNTSRLANRYLPSDEPLCPDIPDIEGINSYSSFSQRLIDRELTLLDVLADISLCRRGDVSATMASLRNNGDTLEMQLYIVFNRDLEDEEVRRRRRHLESIFDMLRKVPHEPPEISTKDSSKKVIPKSLETNLIEICTVIHNYSFEIFTHRITKHKDKLLEIRGYIEQDQTEYFRSQERSKLATSFKFVDMIIEVVAEAQATKQFSDSTIQLVINVYYYWTNHNILPGLQAAADEHTFLDYVDTWLADKHNVDFQLKRWAQKIMSFVISASRLFTLTQTNRLRTYILGKFSVEFLTAPTAAPYSCNLSSEALRAVLNDTLTSSYEADRERFIIQLKGLEASEVVHQFNPTVHAELAMVMAMAKGDITHVLPYIGVSKPSCIMCSHYIRAFNEVMGKTFAVRGSHGKAYPGWSWPISPNHDEELRAAFLKRVRQQLRSDFVHHSSAGSGGPRFDFGVVTDDDILRMCAVVEAERRSRQ